jgi:hypothetical protein
MKHLFSLKEDIELLKDILNNHLDILSAEEQNKLIDLIQKLILMEEIRNTK